MSENNANSRPRRGATIMLHELERGTRLVLKDGATVEVVDNPRDGSWIYVRHLGPSGDGSEELVFAEDVVEVLEDR